MLVMHCYLLVIFALCSALIAGQREKRAEACNGDKNSQASRTASIQCVSGIIRILSIVVGDKGKHCDESKRLRDVTADHDYYRYLTGKCNGETICSFSAQNMTKFFKYPRKKKEINYVGVNFTCDQETTQFPPTTAHKTSTTAESSLQSQTTTSAPPTTTFPNQTQVTATSTTSSSISSHSKLIYILAGVLPGIAVGTFIGVAVCFVTKKTRSAKPKSPAVKGNTQRVHIIGIGENSTTPMYQNTSHMPRSGTSVPGDDNAYSEIAGKASEGGPSTLPLPVTDSDYLTSSPGSYILNARWTKMYNE